MAAKSVCSILRRAIFINSRACLCGRRYLSSDLHPDNVSFTKRTHTCGELRRSDVGKEVVLCGWLQYHRMGVFLLLRDWQGLTQAVIPDDKRETLLEDMSRLSQESVVQVKGTVQHRPPGQENKKMETGDIEVVVGNVQVLNTCKPTLPFEVKQFHQVKESLRMRYRYLDIRQAAMQRNLRLRSRMIMTMREFLCNRHGFVDVETPTLFRKTPGGAKEFIVPSHSPGKFYSLPQSPQQFKQLLMVGGIDRYFQIAKCYRDEGAKPDRQPEFTQVDIEMSFTDADSVVSLIENLLKNCWPSEKGDIRTPFPRMSYQEAMSRFGVDKPDTRFDVEMTDISDILQSCSSPVIHSTLQSDLGSVQAICLPQATKHLSNKDMDSIMAASREGLSGVTVLSGKLREDSSWQGGVAKSLDHHTMLTITERLHAHPGDIVVIAAGDKYKPHTVLGRLRLKCADRMEDKGVEIRKKGVYNFLWVDNFPLFLPREDGVEGLESAHHPFTAPHPDDEQLLYSRPDEENAYKSPKEDVYSIDLKPLQVRGQHYDLVLNGAEIGGGSIRIHNSNMQTYVLENILKDDASQLNHLLEALDSGCPPHGGIALGLDRLLAIICDAESIRDVIAFPKSHDGKDPMSGAPSGVSKEDLDFYHIKVNT